jgi:hypothetical protein
MNVAKRYIHKRRRVVFFFSSMEYEIVEYVEPIIINKWTVKEGNFTHPHHTHPAIRQSLII